MVMGGPALVMRALPLKQSDYGVITMSQEVIRGIALPPPAQPGDPLARVDTPSLVLDLAPFEANLRAMQAWADRHDGALRPHAKAHKGPESALRQGALDARGICCQQGSPALPLRWQ